MIGPVSRYATNAGGIIVRLQNSSGTYNLSVLRTVQPQSVPFTLYIWKMSDRLDSVAYRLFGDASLWWTITDLNPEILDPLSIPTGAVIRVPTGSFVQSQSTLTQ